MGILIKSMRVFSSTTSRVSSVYDESRWHKALGSVTDSLSKGDLVAKHGSWQKIIVRMLRRVLLAILTGKAIERKDKVLPPSAERNATYAEIVATGMIDEKRIEGGNTILVAPLLVVLVMNNMVPVLPLKAKIENPFESDFGIFGRIAMASLHLRCVSFVEFGETRFNLTDLRPGAQWQGPAIELLMPSDPTFNKLALHLEAMNVSSLEVNQVLITATGQPNFDGAAIFNALIDNAPFTVVILSQSKWQMDLNPATGLASNSSLHDKVINEELIPGMRAKFEECRSVFPPDPLFIVYEVFSVRDPPKRVRLSEFDLGINEGLFVTRKDNFEKVVGSTLAVRNRLRVEE